MGHGSFQIKKQSGTAADRAGAVHSFVLALVYHPVEKDGRNILGKFRIIFVLWRMDLDNVYKMLKNRRKKAPAPWVNGAGAEI
ncbi:hypothetical protein B5F27_01445 [Faecalibacterium sp. An192]|nr:hypothetical protein B5F27_01445 [Faecalibacterium sp. An192]